MIKTKVEAPNAIPYHNAIQPSKQSFQTKPCVLCGDRLGSETPDTVGVLWVWWSIPYLKDPKPRSSNFIICFFQPFGNITDEWRLY